MTHPHSVIETLQARLETATFGVCGYNCVICCQLIDAPFSISVSVMVADAETTVCGILMFSVCCRLKHCLCNVCTQFVLFTQYRLLLVGVSKFMCNH